MSGRWRTSALVCILVLFAALNAHKIERAYQVGGGEHVIGSAIAVVLLLVVAVLTWGLVSCVVWPASILLWRASKSARTLVRDQPRSTAATSAARVSENKQPMAETVALDAHRDSFTRTLREIHELIERDPPAGSVGGDA